jgi:hypothetical protein
MSGQMPPQGYSPSQGYQPNVPLPQGYPSNLPPAGYPSGAPQQGPGGYYQTPQSVLAGPKLENLGARVDGWADVIPGNADKVDELEKAFLNKMNERKIASSKLGRIDFAAGTAWRGYQVYNTASGAVAVSFGAIGKDLQVSWDLYVRQKPKWMTLLILLGVAFGLSFFRGLAFGFSFGGFLLNWIFGTVDQLLLVIVGAIIAGKILYGSIWSFFIQKPDAAAQQELTGMAISVHQVIKQVLGEAGVDLAGIRSKNGFRAADEEKKV